LCNYVRKCASTLAVPKALKAVDYGSKKVAPIEKYRKQIVLSVGGTEPGLIVKETSILTGDKRRDLMAWPEEYCLYYNSC